MEPHSDNARAFSLILCLVNMVQLLKKTDFWSAGGIIYLIKNSVQAIGRLMCSGSNFSAGRKAGQRDVATDP